MGRLLPGRSRPFVLALLALVLVLVAAAAVLPAPARAVPPFDLPDELVDTGGALTDPEAVRSAQDALVTETGRQLFVAVVDDLDGAAGQDWLSRTAELSGLGEQDLALVVTTAADGGQPVTAALRVPDGAGFRSSDVATVRQEVDRAAAGGDPQQVVGSALAGLREAGVEGPGEAATRTLWWLAGAVVVLGLVAGLVLWLGRRARRATRDAADRERATALSSTLGSAVVALDHELQEAQLQTDLAEAEVHDERSEAALARAREALTEARREADEIHRRRAELTLGPADDLTWRVAPDRAVAELEKLQDLAATARARLSGQRPG